MSSPGDIQRTYMLLQRIEELLTQLDLTVDRAQDKVHNVTVNAILAERLLNSILLTTKRISGDETLDKYISNVQRAIMLVNTLRIVSAMLVSSNPWMAAIGFASLIGAAYTIPDLIGSFG